MLSRFVWPIQAAARAHPLTSNLLLLAVAGLLIAGAWAGAGLDRAVAVAIAAALVAGLSTARSLPVACAVAGSAAAGGAATALAEAPEWSPAVIGIAAAMQLPLARALADARHPDALASAVGRGSSFLGYTAQLGLVAFGVSSWAASCGCAVAMAAGALWPAAAGAWRRLEPPLHPDQARALPPERTPGGRDVLISSVALGVLAVIACLHPWHLPTATRWTALIIASLWLVMTWRPLLAVAIVGGELVAAGFVHGAAESPLLPAALIAGQLLPMLAWSAHLAGRPPALALVGLVAFAIAVPFVAAGLAVPVLLMGASGWMAVIAARRRPLAGTSALRLARRASGDLSPYWRHYLRGKLLFDPLYRQLAGDAARWGRVLDAGCGPGLVAMLAAGRADTEGYCGIDLDEDKLVVARRLLARCGRPLNDRWQLLHGRLPLPQPLPQRFDTVFLLDVLHYWPTERQGELLAHLRGALAPGGRLWLREGIADAEGSAGRVALGERFTTLLGLNPATGHLAFPTREGLEAQLVAASFRVEECLESGGENRLFRCAAI